MVSLTRRIWLNWIHSVTDGRRRVEMKSRPSSVSYRERHSWVRWSWFNNPVATTWRLQFKRRKNPGENPIKNRQHCAADPPARRFRFNWLGSDLIQRWVSCLIQGDWWFGQAAGKHAPILTENWFADRGELGRIESYFESWTELICSTDASQAAGIDEPGGGGRNPKRSLRRRKAFGGRRNSSQSSGLSRRFPQSQLKPGQG